MADQNFDLPVGNGSYSGSNRAKSAMKGASSGKPVAGDTGPASQSDNHIQDGDSNLKQDSKPRVLNTNTKAATGATPPNNVNPDGRPGLGASALPTKNNRGQ